MSLTWYSEYWGDAWEDLCHNLLPRKHGASYQNISDKGGDCGLDGIVAVNGIAYQAYGQEPNNTNPQGGLTNKINTDLKKLQKNEAEIAEILGEHRIKTWVLLFNGPIPHNNIHGYLTSKKREVRKWGLSILDPKIELMCHPPSYLQSEWDEHIKLKEGRIEIPIPPAKQMAIAELKKNERFQKIQEKFTVISLVEDDATEFAKDHAKAHFDYSAQLDAIQTKEPELYSTIFDIISDVEKVAKEGSIFQGDYSNLTSTRTTLERRLDVAIGDKIEPKTTARVRDFVIADWLVRCPLKFK